MEIIKIRQDVQGTRVFCIGGMNLVNEQWMVHRRDSVEEKKTVVKK